MHRFYLPPERSLSRPLELTEAEAHHALHVLRLKLGDRVVVLSGLGTSLACKVCAATRNSLKLEVVEETRQPPSQLQILLFQAVPKGKTMDSIIQKATELGTAFIFPILTERSVPDLAGERLERKGEKWQQVAIEAIKQCGQLWMPHVMPPLAWPLALTQMASAELNLVASLQPGAVLLRRHVEEYQSRTGRKPNRVGLWIGPEGDFTPGEIQALLHHGARPITLGQLTLRVETAAICALSLLNAEYW